MPHFGIVFPVLAGKQPLIREICSQLQQRRAEYEASRSRAGMSVERAYLQDNPDGSGLVLAYIEADRPFKEGLKAIVDSDAAIDRYFVEKNNEATGIDFRTLDSAPEPEQVASWCAPGYRQRQRGFAFAAPLREGQTDAARAFAREAYETRKDELTESRLAQQLGREEVFLNQTLMGDLVVVYLEGPDPAASNRQFAASNTPYDRWFKDRCKAIFPDYITFDEPVPDNEEAFSWVRGA